MQKVRKTKTEMRNRYDQIIKIGYCDAQFLLNYENPIAYSTRAEGWACDYYDIDGVLISTGYAPLDDKNAKHDYDLIRQYDDKAREIIHSYGEKSFEQQKEEVTQLLKEFVSEVGNY